MKTDNLLLGLAILAVVVSAVGFGATYMSLTPYGYNLFTGYATSSGTVNLTITSSAAINFTTNTINFGTGVTNNGTGSATLQTTGVNNWGGTWTNVSQGFIVENIGNINVTINFTADKSAATFIGGTGSKFQINVTNNETSSCNNVSTTFALNTWYDANATGWYACSNMSYVDSSDAIRVDVKLIIPTDSITGTLGSIITATANAAY